MLKCVLAAGMLASAVGNAQAGTWPPKWWGGESANAHIGATARATLLGETATSVLDKSTSEALWLSEDEQVSKSMIFCANPSYGAGAGAGYAASGGGMTGLPTAESPLFGSLLVSCSLHTASSALGFPGAPDCAFTAHPGSSCDGVAESSASVTLLRPAIIHVGSLSVSSGEIYSGMHSASVRALISGPSGVLLERGVSLPASAPQSLTLQSGSFRVPPGTYTVRSEAISDTSATSSSPIASVISSAGVLVSVVPILCPESITIPTTYTVGGDAASSAGFSCFVRMANVEAIEYRWYRNNVPLTDSPNGVPQIQGSQTSNLSMQNVTREYEGVYTCVVTSSDGCPPLTVLGGTISFVDPECTEVAEVVAVSSPRVSTCVGREMRFEVGVARMEDMHFLHDGQVLSDGVLASGAVVSGAGTNVLTISNVTTSESGSYGVVAQGACGPIVGAELFDASVASSCCPADFTGDAMVDDADFVLFVGAYNLLDCADPEMGDGCPCDLTGDALVEDSDFVVFVGAYNELVCP